MVAVQHSPATDRSGRSPQPTTGVRVGPHPVRAAPTRRPRRRPTPRTFPAVGFAAAGGAAILRVTGDGVLRIADELAYSALDRTDRFAVRSGPLTYLGLVPATVARVAYTVGSDLAHGVLTGS